jgi:regulator of nonsense transcripts 2
METSLPASQKRYCIYVTTILSCTDNTQDSDDDEAAKQASSDEEEQIIVTRPEDERDPEADAEFDRELAKLMSESAESRKFERKPVFDVPLPMRRAREVATNTEDSGNESPAPPLPTAPCHTMKFSLLSKRGNKNQTRTIDLPSDSTFAVAMRNKQQADKEEQQRIKSLVLNYNEARDDADDTGDIPFHSTLHPNTNRKHTESSQGGLDKTPNPYAQPRLDKAGHNRSNQRARKLQLNDFNWYDSHSYHQRKESASGLGFSLRKGAVADAPPRLENGKTPTLRKPSQYRQTT